MILGMNHLRDKFQQFIYQSSRIVNKAEQSIPERFEWAAPSQEVPYCILNYEFLSFMIIYEVGIGE